LDLDVNADRASSADLAYELIQKLIVTGVLKPYELLTENDLARRVGSGRTPVREALQRLRLEGFVEVMPRRGILVTPVDIHRQLELLETRRPLEELMVYLAAARATTEQRDEMRRLADDLEAAIANNDRARYLDINKAIHLLEARSAHNRYLEREIGVLHSLSRRFWYSFIADTQSFAQAAELHARTLRAIAAGDATEAREACRQLLDLLEQVARKTIMDRTGTLPPR
jgi:DNA-binding GntR family transcriptional regulator